jgi:hypothetical protein
MSLGYDAGLVEDTLGSELASVTVGSLAVGSVTSRSDVVALGSDMAVGSVGSETKLGSIGVGSSY